MAAQSQTVFTQKRNGTKLVFSLGEDKLAFTHSDASGENCREIPWEQLNLDTSSTVRTKGYYLKQPDKVVLFLGVLMLLMSQRPSSTVLLFFGTLFTGLGLRLFISRRRGIGFSIFKTAETPIRIIQDTQHDLILSELRKYRGRRLKKLFGAVNKATDPQKETAKFQWLKTVGAITEEELEQAKVEILGRKDSEVELTSPVVH